MANEVKIKTRKLNKKDNVVIDVDNKEKVADKKVKTRKIRMSLSKAEEQKLDKAMEKEEKMSIMLIVIILALCFIVGISLGYILYRIALTGAI